MNNVGFAPDLPSYLHKIRGGMKTNRNTCIINCLPVVMTTNMVVAEMSDRGGGIIVNVGSSASSYNFYYWSVIRLVR